MIHHDQPGQGIPYIIQKAVGVSALDRQEQAEPTVRVSRSRVETSAAKTWLQSIKTVQQLQLAQSGCVRADFPICPAVPLGKSHEIDITAGQVRALYYQQGNCSPSASTTPAVSG